MIIRQSVLVFALSRGSECTDICLILKFRLGVGLGSRLVNKHNLHTSPVEELRLRIKTYHTQSTSFGWLPNTKNIKTRAE